MRNFRYNCFKQLGFRILSNLLMQSFSIFYFIFKIRIYKNYRIMGLIPQLTLAGTAKVIDPEKFCNYFPNKPASTLY